MSEQVDQLAKVIWDYMLMYQELRPMEAILILGSNDIRTAKRAAEVFHAGYAPRIICSGGIGKDTVFGKPEALVLADILMSEGIPREKVILESKSTNTGENIRFTRALLLEQGLDWRSFIVVQKPYMERRTWATVKKQWPEGEFVVTSPQLSFDEYFPNQVFKDEALHLMVGDLERIKEYPALGFQIFQDIPNQVWKAHDELVSLGFTRYALKQ